MIENDDFENNNQNQDINQNSKNPDYINNDEDDISQQSELEEQKISQYYTKRRLKQHRMERKVRKSQLWIVRFRILLRLCLLALMLFCGYKLLRIHQWYLPQNIFYSINNKSLEVLNNRIVPSSKILAQLRKTTIPHEPIYKFDTSEIKENLMQLDPVENVYVRRFWFPARLQINIEEKQPIITVSPAENVQPIAFFTSDGKLIGRDYMPLKGCFKTVLVLSYGTRGDDYHNWKLDKLQRIQQLAKAVETCSGEQVQFVDYRNPRDIYIKIKTANIRLGKVDDTVFNRIKRIPSILPQVKTLDKPIKYIDLRWINTNYIKLG